MRRKIQFFDSIRPIYGRRKCGQPLKKILEITDKIKSIRLALFSSEQGGKPNAAKAMWRIEGTVRAKKMRQDGAAEFISASLGYGSGKDASK